MEHTLSPKQNLHKAIFFMLISTVSFTVMNATVKYLEDYTSYELVFFRSIGTFFICLFLLRKMKIPMLGNQRKLLLLRAIAGAISMYGFFIAIKLIPFGSAVTFRYLAPIFAALFAVWFLKEKIRKIQWLFFFMSFVGVILLKGFDMRINIPGLTSALIAAVGTGFVFILIRKIGIRDHPLVVVIYFMAVTMVSGGILSLFNWKTPSGWEWIILLNMGIVGFLGQYFMTKAFQIVETSKIAPLKYTEAVFALLVGWLWFDESYTAVAAVGILLIIAGMVLNVVVRSE
ncbi:MAG: drug/metabolite transporter (DMT)-like permease [Saprospiraceae bacterium]|jgi:drug/metabolite transporter (DMT)-like permease